MNGKLMSLSSKVGRLIRFLANFLPCSLCEGNEAGGHGVAKSLSLFTLFPLISEALIAATDGHPPPLVGAGGLAIGTQIASLLTLGVSGVVLGTRFLLSPESLYTDSQRQALIAADSSDSVRTMAFDYVRNILGWPEGVDGRALRNGKLMFSRMTAKASYILFHRHCD